MTWVAVAVGGAALVGSVYSSNQAKKAADRSNQTAQQQADISQHLIDQTDPLRQMLIDRSQSFLSKGSGDVFSSPTYLAIKDAANKNFSRAKNNTLATVPNGGALLDSLAGLEGQRASTLTQGAGQVYDAELARALSLSTGQLPVAMSGLSAAGSTQATNAYSMAQQNSAKNQSMGQAAGAYLGSK